MLIFDLDGTLVDSRADLAAAVNHVLRGSGLPELSEAVVAGYVGDGARRLLQRAVGTAPGVDLDDALRRFLAYYGAHLLDRTRAYPGIPETLAAVAARGITQAVLSNKPAAMSRTILEGLGLSRFFAAVLGGDSLPAPKPDPAGVRRLCAETGAPPSAVLLVGDSPVDLQTARAAGVGFCGVTWGFAAAGLRAAAATPLIDGPDELLELMERV